MTILFTELLNKNASPASGRGGWGQQRKQRCFLSKKNRSERMSVFCKEKGVFISWLEEEKVLSTIYSHSIWGKYNIS